MRYAHILQKEVHILEIEYTNGGKVATIDGYRFTRDNRTGYYLSSKPINGSRKRLHVYVWEKHNGAIPKGYQVHHIEMDKSKNEISDLVLLSVSEHQKLHAENFTEERLEKMRRNLTENARPKACEWHKSDAGREWHKQHGRDVWKKRKPKTYTCTNCGKEFESLNCYSAKSNRFCCNNCKSAYRRKLGIDNETRRCSICGGEFTANKYSRAKRCAKCRHIKHQESGD